MGLDFNLHVGAYLECQNKLVEVDKMGKECCGSVYSDEKVYCSICGSELKESVINTIKDSTVDVSEVSEKIEDLFYRIPSEDNDLAEDSVDIWTGDSLNTETIGILDLTHDEVRQNYMHKFIVENKKEIKIIQDAYGKDNVVLKFGVISYYD